MLFASLKFLVFLAITMVIYWCSPNVLKKVEFLVFSMVFYYTYGYKNLIFLFAMIIISWCCGWLIKKTNNKIVLFFSIVISVTPLIVSKYYNFGIDNINRLFERIGFDYSAPVMSIVAPVGISFFTFKIISYLVEQYKGTIPGRMSSLLDYAVYVSFFPTILSGPIDRPNHFLSQIQSKKKWNYIQVVNGFLIMLYGYFQKMLIADRLAPIVNTVFTNYESYEGFPLFVNSILYSLQIYFDFSGYTFIVIGIAKMFGYQCMENFIQPYFATSIKDFWRRWHVSLSSWLRDYIYIPLGGNRKGKVRQHINILITFFVSGIWHGAGWNYIFWGLMHGLYQVIGSLTHNARSHIKTKLNIIDTTLERCFSMIITFLLVNFAWVVFWANGDIKFYDIIKSMFAQSTVEFGWIMDLGVTSTEILVLVLALVVVWCVDDFRNNRQSIINMFWQLKLPIRYILVYGIIFTIILFGYYGAGYDASAFIYFQF